MALSTYTELQAAIRTEMSNLGTSALSTAAVVDCIARAEAKINRRVRLREMERVSTTTFSTSSTTIEDRQVDLPDGYVEFLDLRWKLATQSDTAYTAATYVAPTRIHEYYGRTDGLWYTLRKQLEFNRHTDGATWELMMHYLKRWDIATDETNWLLTNYPDAYLYGACMEVALHMKDDPTGYKVLFDSALVELEALSERGRDDAALSTAELAAMTSRGTYNILRG